MATTENNLQTISWDNSNIYKSFKDEKITKDLGLLTTNTDYLKTKMPIFENLIGSTAEQKNLEETIPLARECYRLALDTELIIWELSVYASTAASVNALDYDAKNLSSQVMKAYADLNKAMKPLNLFLLRSPQTYLDSFLKDASVDELTFTLNHSRQANDFLLNVGEEVLLEGHAVDGFHAWGKLYTDIAGALKVDLNGEKMGVAQASNILFGADRTEREAAYKAVNAAWESNEISAAAILSSINGWRIENNKTRSTKRELHYLDKSCFGEKITRPTLDAMMQTVYDNRNIGQDALRLMAREMKVDKLGPWDILAPYPSQGGDKKIPFPEAMDIITHSFNEFDPAMADFAKMMVQKRWIDATPSENRASGAYCTGFDIVREPRVFITYQGNMKNVITLAHELGHAYHSWVMRDLKWSETSYSSSLAETASIFAETLVRNTMLKNAKTPEEKKEILWLELESAGSFLVNIPARYDFECRAVELRKTKSITAPEFKALTRDAWKNWYGDTLSDYNEMFWASKLHFSITHMGFYNYPYLFGYLFSLGIYAKKNEYGESFKKLYTDILRDTGVMTAEAIIQKHFKEDISQKAFWDKSLKIVAASVEQYKAL